MSEPLVYIILLNWNDAPLTSACIRSLQQMDYSDYQIVVVDNGSTDGSDKKIERDFPGVTLLRSSENVGFTGGNNIGIRYALEHHPDYIWILNNDTTVEPDALGLMVRRMEEDPSLGILGSTILDADGDHKVQVLGGGYVKYRTAQHRNNTSGDGSETLDYIMGCSMLIRSPVLEQLGMFDERIFIYWEDVDLSHRVTERGYTIGYVPEARIYHKGSAAMISGSSRTEYYYCQGTVIFFRTHVRFWIFPVAVSYLGKIMLRLGRGEFAKIRAVTRGFKDGLLLKPPKY